MTKPHGGARQILVDGQQTSKGKLADWGGYVEDQLDELADNLDAGTRFIRETLTELNAVVGAVNEDYAQVLDDGANSGFYEYQTDQWVKVAELRDPASDKEPLISDVTPAQGSPAQLRGLDSDGNLSLSYSFTGSLYAKQVVTDGGSIAGGSNDAIYLSSHYGEIMAKSEPEVFTVPSLAVVDDIIKPSATGTSLTDRYGFVEAGLIDDAWRAAAIGTESVTIRDDRVDNGAYFTDRYGFVDYEFSAGEFRAGGMAGGYIPPHTVESPILTFWGENTDALCLMWKSSTQGGGVVEYTAEGSTAWQSATSFDVWPIPGEGGYWHKAVMSGMSQGARYSVRWPGSTATDVLRVPSSSGLRFYAASDYQSSDFSENSNLAVFGGICGDADFVIWNGDYVSDDGVKDDANAQLWFGFLERISASWRRDGALVPILMTVGNHEASNLAGGDNALVGGDGVLGYIENFMAWGFHPDHPTKAFNGVATVNIGRQLAVITLESDHTVPIESQLPHFQSALANAHAVCQNIVVVSHCPAFLASGSHAFDNDGQNRVLRTQFWPAMEAYADKIVAVVVGHEHIGTITDRLRIDYDDQISLSDNDSRWIADASLGVRQTGSGLVGPHKKLVSIAKASAVSSLDASPMMLGAIGWDEAAQSVQTYGTVTNAIGDTQHVWRFDVSDTARSGAAINKNGDPFLSFSETF